MQATEIFSYLISPQLQETLFPLKILFLIISLFLILFILISSIKTKWLRYIFLEDFIQFFTFRPYGLKKLTKKWHKITDRLEIASESEYKLAVIEAEDMLDDILKKMGYTGKDLDERLKQLNPIILDNIDQVRENHKLRNNIVHDPDYKLTLDQAKKMIKVYEQAFLSLEVF